MQAVVIPEPFQMHIEQLERPSPKANEVLVKVAAAGICAGDQYIFTGKNPYATFPCVAGHEIAGTIAELGEGVTELQIGQAVAVEPFIGCGQCYACSVGKSNCCSNLTIIGNQLWGGYAEYVVAPAKNIYPVPADMPLWKASMAEPITIAIHACERGAVSSQDTVLVMGCGPIGMNIIEVARERGAKVYACDINPERLKVAEYLGASVLLSDDSLKEKILDITQNQGMPVVIECAGVPTVMEQAVDLVAAGGRVVIVGLVKKGTPISLPGLDFTRKELTIHGSRTEVGNFPEAIDLLYSGKLKFAEMASHLNMWDAPAIFEELKNKPDKYFKGILHIEKHEE
jgi:L-gulonate 5-dehydrogenase